MTSKPSNSRLKKNNNLSTLATNIKLPKPEIQMLLSNENGYPQCKETTIQMRFLHRRTIRKGVNVE